ncbi:AraC family transcriptional regulator [uncultured Roseobacter sp.]|uniref:AraC family transcriptional regulator n=1 Tax=uncultured Roseobacter sp. TaxID=114847 RepID=UPI00261E4584|nr:AraC family transcriptional regulator [uncultured Roseobacter sp.]
MSGPRYAVDPEARFDSYAEFYRNSAYAQFEHEHRCHGSLTSSIIRVQQTPIDLIDAAVPEYVFIREHNPRGEVWIDVGEGWQISGNIPEHNIHLIPPNTETAFRVEHEHSITSLAIKCETVDRTLAEAGLSPSAFGWFYGRMRRNVPAIRSLDRLWNVCDQLGPSAGLLADGLVLQFLAHLTDDPGRFFADGVRPEDARIARVVDYIEAHYGEALTIAELAAIACLSPAHLSRTFKATVGEPVWSYVTQRRCERAKEMLLTTNLPIAEIAYRCGFANQPHLTRTFKAAYGTTPAAARR